MQLQVASGAFSATCNLQPATCNLLSAKHWRRFGSDSQQEDAEHDGGQEDGHKQDLHHDLRTGRLEALADQKRHGHAAQAATYQEDAGDLTRNA